MVRALLFLAIGLAVGALSGYALSGRSVEGRVAASSPDREGAASRGALDQSDRIAELEAEIERLRALLAQVPETAAPSPYPGDTVENVERLMQEVYETNSIDWLLEVIERLLLLGEEGHPVLRRLIEDVVFRGKFVPSQQDFRANQMYDALGVATRRESEIIAFLNFLLTDPNTVPMLKQGALIAAAYYVGSSAPGSDELKQTLMQIFLEQGGAGLPPSMLGAAGKQLQIFAMAMSGDPRMIPPLQQELKGAKDDRTTASVISALAYLGDPTVVDAIEPRLDPTQGNHRREIEALGRLGTDRAHEVAHAYLRRIPDEQRFYQHASRYLTAGGGVAAVAAIRARFEDNPADPSVRHAVGSLSRYPTPESRDTLRVIAERSPDEGLRREASDAAEEVDRKLRGELPPIAYGRRENE